jgi:hypothetical protein
MDFNGNRQLQLAYNFVQFTDRNIFLTGKAGTGKTTFLRFLKESSPKRMIVVAPTGVAAINAGGVTIHSFFQLSFGPQLPDEVLIKENKNEHLKSFHRFNKTKINIIKSLDLLVIDEISMVRADLLDGIDRVLRKIRNTNKPFGGLQLLLIGDLQQLAPVAKENEWSLLRDYYKTPYFFSSTALQKTNYITIELKHVYRQKDKDFINLLNKIRGNKIDETTVKELNRRYKPDFDFDKEGYIILTTHNYKSDNINELRLKKLKGKEYKFKAKISGNFPEYTYPTDSELILKEGAQVMFVKNDPDMSKRFYNGKIGKIVEITKEFIKVKCDDDDESIIVEPLVWEKTKYTLDKETKEIKEELEGTFTQIPLKLAWAITIHKSQGLTFDKVIIDANKSFAHGQVYVALSRCKTLEGIILKTPISSQSIKHDLTIKSYSNYYEEHQPDETTLKNSKKTYQTKLLKDLFTFDRIIKQIYYLIKVSKENATSFQGDIKKIFEQMSKEVNNNIIEVSLKFEHQLMRLINESSDIENDNILQERVKKASEYFTEKIDLEVIRKIETIHFETDNKNVKQLINDALEKLYSYAAFKNSCLKSVNNGFNVKTYLDAQAKASIEDIKLNIKKEKTKEKTTISDNISHPELYNRLKAWRDVVSAEENKPVFMVIQLKTIKELSEKLPVTLPALKSIKGLGKTKIRLYGAELLEIILDYCDEINYQHTEYKTTPHESKKTVKTTYEKTLDLWKQGKTINEIAKEREKALSTINNHIEKLISKGDISVEEVMDNKKIKTITEHILKSDTKLISEIKESLGDDYNYEEIRFVLSHLIFNEII